MNMGGGFIIFFFNMNELYAFLIHTLKLPALLQILFPVCKKKKKKLLALFSSHIINRILHQIGILLNNRTAIFKKIEKNLQRSSREKFT